MSDMVAKLVSQPASIQNSKANIAQAIPHGARGDDGQRDLLEDALRDLEEVRQQLVNESEKFRVAFHGITHQLTSVIEEAGESPALLASVVADVSASMPS
jgi:ABC-type transporter Mla subunit MlaD